MTFFATCLIVILMGSVFGRRGRPFNNETESLSKIYRWFFAPILDSICKAGDDEFHHLAHLVGVDQRVYSYFQAKASFKIPGVYLEIPARKIRGLPESCVSVGASVLVRKEPVLARYHLSVWHNTGNEEERVYELEESEWKSIQRYLEVVPDPCSHSPST